MLQNIFLTRVINGLKYSDKTTVNGCNVKQLSWFLCTSVRCQTESCLHNLGHLMVASDTNGLPNN